MENLKKSQLANIKGGGYTFWLILGIFDGYQNPNKCNNG